MVSENASAGNVGKGITNSQALLNFHPDKKQSHLGGETISNKNDSVNLFEKSVDMVSNVEKRSFAEEQKIVSIELFESG